jgi:Domian of unknown function (DUF4952)
MSWSSTAAIAATLAAASLGSGVVRAAPTCGDFLGKLTKKPTTIEYVSCEPGSKGQLKALVATYRVKGQHASQVESYLIRETGMAKLRFYCCGWEPNTRRGSPEGSLNLSQEQQYEVSMLSEETLVSTRRQWSRIQWFYVSVTLLAENA